MKKLPTAAIIMRKSMLSFFRNIKDENPSLAMLYPEIMAVATKRSSAGCFRFRVNSKISPKESSIAERTMRMILLSSSL